MGDDRADNRDYAKQCIDYSNSQQVTDEWRRAVVPSDRKSSSRARTNGRTSERTVRIRVARRTRRETTGASARKVVRSEYELTHLLTRPNVWSRIYWQRGPKARTVVSPCGPQVERSPLIAFSHTLLLFLLLPTSACASPSSSSFRLPSTSSFRYTAPLLSPLSCSLSLASSTSSVLVLLLLVFFHDHHERLLPVPEWAAIFRKLSPSPLLPLAHSRFSSRSLARALGSCPDV